ncbi:MAG: hypothetical protein KDE34_14065 [Anaerolineales bacterium]|nr:hypothetical protein [Anaerolineales bacterium]
MEKIRSLYNTWHFRRRQKQHRLALGQLTPDEAVVQLTGAGHMPLASVWGNENKTTIHIPPDDAGHLLLVAPPDSGYGEQLGQILIHWPDAALVIDPAGTLYRQTGYYREMTWGKVFAVPGYRFNLARYYPFWDAEAARRLHSFLISSISKDEVWLRERSVSLLHALGLYSFAHRLNPLQLLLDAASADLLSVLAALAAVPAARQLALIFTKGQSARQALADPDVVRSFDLFCRALAPYQRLYPTLAMEASEALLPHDWMTQPRSLYVTYPYAQQLALAGFTAALIEGVRQYHHTYGRFQQLLLVLPTDMAQHLPPLEQMLTEASAYGITVVLTAPSLAALDALAADGNGAALAGRFAHQVWYPPHDQATAAHMSWHYGTRLQSSNGLLDEAESNEKAALAPEMFLGWPREQVLVYTRRERPYRFIANQVKRPADLPERPAPIPPKIVTTPRNSSAWLSGLIGLPYLLPGTEQLSASGTPVHEPGDEETAVVNGQTSVVQDIALASPAVDGESARTKPDIEGEEETSLKKSYPPNASKFR